MFIKKIHILNFGKISDMHLGVSKGLNVIYAPNESGKTTLLSFIKYIFYGTKQKKSHGDLTFKERYMPWSGLPMSGSIEFEDNTGEYSVQRTDSEHINKLVTTDMTTGEMIPEITVPGIKFMGFGEKSFSDSCFISDVKSLNDAKSDGELVSFFSMDGNTETTYNNIKDNVCERLAQLSSTKRKSSKLVNVQTNLKNKRAILNDINNSIKDLETRFDELQNNEQQLKKLICVNNEIKMQKRQNDICKLKREAEELVAQKNKLESDINDFATNDCISVSQEEKAILCEDFSELTQKIRKQSYSRICNILLFFFLSMCLVVFAWLLPVGIYFIVPALLCGILNFWQGCIIYKKSKSLNKLSSELSAKKTRKQDVMKRYGLSNKSDCILLLANCNIHEAIKSKQSFGLEQIKYINNRLSEIKQILGNDSNLMQITETDIKNFTNEDIDAIIEDNEKKISLLTLSVNRDLHYKDELQTLKNQANDISEEIRILEDELNEINKQVDILNTALVILDNSYSKTKGSFFPELSQKTYEFFSRITGNVYNSLVTDDEFNISVNKNGFMRSAKYLSTGTFDILYFSLRLAIIHTMSQKGVCVPVFIDDVFSGCDDKRIDKIMDLLYELSKDNQIFLCTPRSREGEYFKDNKEINIINL